MLQIDAACIMKYEAVPKLLRLCGDIEKSVTVLGDEEPLRVNRLEVFEKKNGLQGRTDAFYR